MIPLERVVTRKNIRFSVSRELQISFLFKWHLMAKTRYNGQDDLKKLNNLQRHKKKFFLNNNLYKYKK